MEGEAEGPREGGGSGREARLAAALRENLRRRKDQARARKSEAGRAATPPTRDADTHER